jgi:hypothetical protein
MKRQRKLKNQLIALRRNQKRPLREFIETNNKHVGSALDTNAKMVNSIKENFNGHSIDDSITDTLKTTFGKSVELAEDTQSDFAKIMHKSMHSYTEHVSKAHNNVLEYFLIPFYIKGLTC